MFSPLDFGKHPRLRSIELLLDHGAGNKDFIMSEIANEKEGGKVAPSGSINSLVVDFRLLNLFSSFSQPPPPPQNPPTPSAEDQPVLPSPRPPPPPPQQQQQQPSTPAPLPPRSSPSGSATASTSTASRRATTS